MTTITAKSHRRSALLALVIAVASLVTLAAAAKDKNELVDVHGRASVTVSDHDNVTLHQAKERAIAEAQADAMRRVFGELISADIVTTDMDLNGETMTSYYENTLARVKGEWMANNRKPLITVAYDNDMLTFTAEVWGKARNIQQAQTPIDLKVYNCGPKGQRSVTGERLTPAVCTETTTFNSGDALMFSYSVPAKGYLVVYLLDMTNDDVTCLLPYGTGEARMTVEGGKTYKAFDHDNDRSQLRLQLTTKKPIDHNQLVVVYSPNPFIKCQDVSSGSGDLRVCSTLDFSNWLLKNQRADNEMTVKKMDLIIQNPK